MIHSLWKEHLRHSMLGLLLGYDPSLPCLSSGKNTRSKLTLNRKLGKDK